MCQNDTELAPFSADTIMQTAQMSSTVKQVRQLALIDLANVRYEQLALSRDQLLHEIRQEHQTRTHACETESELLMQAKEVLKTYALQPHHVYANLRFLRMTTMLEEEIIEKTSSLVDEFVALLSSKSLNALLSQMHPNRLATLTVFSHLFVANDR